MGCRLQPARPHRDGLPGAAALGREVRAIGDRVASRLAVMAICEGRAAARRL
jgi:hypothetical protein